MMRRFWKTVALEKRPEGQSRIPLAVVFGSLNAG
jgi:hypothetical protein